MVDGWSDPMVQQRRRPRRSNLWKLGNGRTPPRQAGLIGRAFLFPPPPALDAREERKDSDRGVARRRTADRSAAPHAAEGADETCRQGVCKTSTQGSAADPQRPRKRRFDSLFDFDFRFSVHSVNFSAPPAPSCLPRFGRCLRNRRQWTCR